MHAIGLDPGIHFRLNGEMVDWVRESGHYDLGSGDVE